MKNEEEGRVAIFDCEGFLEDAYEEIKDEFAVLAQIASFERWIQFEFARRFEKNKDRYCKNGEEWRVTCDAGYSSKPDLDIWYDKDPHHFLIEMKILWNNGDFLTTINKGIKGDISKLKKIKNATGIIVVFPVFYCGDADLVHKQFGDSYSSKRLRAVDESQDELIERLCPELSEVCKMVGVTMNEPVDARWYSENWCGTMLLGRIE